MRPGRLIGQMPFGIQLVLVGSTALVMFLALQFGLPALSQPEPAITPAWMTSTSSPTPFPPTETPAHLATETPEPSRTPRPTATLLAPPGGIIYSIKPQVNRVGWVVSGFAENYFGESYLYTGIHNNRLYHGAFQFDISFLAPGSVIHYAAVELTGLDASRIDGAAAWSLQILAPEIDPQWPLHGYQEIHNAAISYTLSPVLESTDLEEGRTNVFVLNAGQREELAGRIARGVVSFRLDGPTSGSSNLFSWDSGYGSDSQGKGPVLRLAVASPETSVTPTQDRLPGLGTATPTYVIITSVPTAENALTAVADAFTATAWAVILGTPTPMPANWVTPIIVTSTPQPLNQSTASARILFSTAEALLTGTPTPTPGNVWTATPTPTYYVITPAPTTENILTAAADALTATAWAATTGTPTALPANWVTPILVTATPQPANPATATAQAALSLAEELLTGTPTPTPPNLWVVTSTPTPMFIYVWELDPSSISTPTPRAIPSWLVGRIGFQSNRRGAVAYYMMNIDGHNVALFTDAWVYQFSEARQVVVPDREAYLSPDGQYIVYAVGAPGQRQIWVANADGSNPLNISNNRYDEYAPVWLRSSAPEQPVVATATPIPTATLAPQQPTPAQPSQPSRPQATATPKPTPPI